MGVIVEKYNDKNGILWPESVAPFRVHLLSLGGADGMPIYEKLQKAGVEVLYDDRDVSAGTEIRGSRPHRHSVADGGEPESGRRKS